jgi:DNA-binding NarL/FixJ family response regulator
MNTLEWQNMVTLVHQNELVARSVAVALKGYTIQLSPVRSTAFPKLFPGPDVLILVDAPAGFQFFAWGQAIRQSWPNIPVIYLADQIGCLRLHLARCCNFAGIISLQDHPLPQLPEIVQCVLDGNLNYSVSVQQMLLNQTPLWSQVSRLTFAQGLVMLQMVMGRKPTQIARTLSCSMGSIYQLQARLRAHFGVSSNTELIALVRQHPVNTGTEVCS